MCQGEGKQKILPNIVAGGGHGGAELRHRGDMATWQLPHQLHEAGKLAFIPCLICPHLSARASSKNSVLVIFSGFFPTWSLTTVPRDKGLERHYENDDNNCQDLDLPYEKFHFQLQNWDNLL